MTDLGLRIAAVVGEATSAKTIRPGLENAERNRPYFGKTIADLEGTPCRSAHGAAIVIVGGPSLHRKESVPRILRSGFDGDVVVADGSLGHSLRHGLIPQYVVTVDSHPTRIIRWFGDPRFSARPADDYFSRQEIDPALRDQEARRNEELIGLVNRHGGRMKLIISTSVDPSVTERCLEAGMELYWWNPLYDDYDRPGSVTRELVEGTGIPCMATGGNVGTASWVFAHAVLGRKTVALVGMDFGYAPGTPIRNTQYYTELVELLGDRASEAYIPIENPHLGETWFTDPTYFWYRQAFLELIGDAGCVTYNCTEGGTLVDPRIPFISLDEFLSRCRSRIGAR